MREGENIRLRLLGMAQWLDEGMEGDVSEWEADFLDSVLKILKAGGMPSIKQIEKLEQMHEAYSVQEDPYFGSDLDAEAGGD